MQLLYILTSPRVPGTAFVLRPLVCPCQMAAPRMLAQCSTYFIRTSSSLASVMTSDIYIYIYIIYTCALRCTLIKHPREPTARTGHCNSKALSTHGVHNVCITLYIHISGYYVYMYIIYMQKKVWSCDLWNVKFQVGVSVPVRENGLTKRVVFGVVSNCHKGQFKSARHGCGVPAGCP
jgi:hypothetical protein